MEIGLIGLGKMGGNMAERLRKAGHTVVGYDQSDSAPRQVSLAGRTGRGAARAAGGLGDGAGRQADR